MKIKNPKASQLIILSGFVILYLFFQRNWMLIVPASLAIVFLTLPKISLLILQAWYFIGKQIGWINSRIILSVIFFFILTPIALIRKIFSNDPMNLKKRKRSTLFVERNHLLKKDDLKNPW